MLPQRNRGPYVVNRDSKKTTTRSARQLKIVSFYHSFRKQSVIRKIIITFAIMASILLFVYVWLMLVIGTAGSFESFGGNRERPAMTGIIQHSRRSVPVKHTNIKEDSIIQIAASYSSVDVELQGIVAKAFEIYNKAPPRENTSDLRYINGNDKLPSFDVTKTALHQQCKGIDLPEWKEHRNTSFLLDFKRKDSFGLTGHHVMSEKGRGFVALEHSGALFVHYVLIQMEHLRTEGKSWSYDKLNGFPTVQVLDNGGHYRQTRGRPQEINEPGSVWHRLHSLWYGHVSKIASLSYPFESVTKLNNADKISWRSEYQGPSWCSEYRKYKEGQFARIDLDWRMQGFGQKPKWWDQFVEAALQNDSASSSKYKNVIESDHNIMLRQCNVLADGPMDEVLGFLNASRVNVHARCPGFSYQHGCGSKWPLNADADKVADDKNNMTHDKKRSLCQDWRLAVLIRDPRDIIISMFQKNRGPASSFDFDLRACPWLGSSNNIHYRGKEHDLCTM